MVKRSLGGAKKKKLLSNVIERMKQIGSIIKSKKDIDVDVVKLDSMINIVDELIEAEAEMSTDPEELRSHDAFVEDRAEQLKNLVGDMVATEKASKG
jgi:chemotaxis protein histidine kinase CheA